MADLTETEREALTDVTDALVLGADIDAADAQLFAVVAALLAEREAALVGRVEAVLREVGSIAAYRRSQSLDDAAAWAFDHSADLVRAALAPDATGSTHSSILTELDTVPDCMTPHQAELFASWLQERGTL